MKILLILLSLGIFIGCASVQNPSSSDISFLIDRQKVEETVNRLFIETDNKNWSELRKIFVEKVRFDMSSLTGISPAVLASSEITNTWQKGLASVAQVHHQSGNFIIKIDKDGAEVFCYGSATHYKNPQFKKNVTTFIGSYNIHLVKSGTEWRIDSLRFNKKYVE